VDNAGFNITPLCGGFSNKSKIAYAVLQPKHGRISMGFLSSVCEYSWLAKTPMNKQGFTMAMLSPKPWHGSCQLTTFKAFLTADV